MKNNRKPGRVAVAFFSALAIGSTAVSYLLGAGGPESDDVQAPAPNAASGGRAPDGKVLASPFSAAFAASAAPESAEPDHTHASIPAAGQTDQPPADEGVLADRSQDLHIAESRRNYSLFLSEPDGYRKYAYLAAVQVDHIAGLEERIYNQHLLYQGRLGFDELLQQVRSNPTDHEANADHYRRMLDIMARMPCPPDEYWNGCVRHSLGVTRNDIENAQAEVSNLRDEQRLAQLQTYLSHDDHEFRDGEYYTQLYEGLTPLLSRAVEGDEQVLQRFRLTAHQAIGIVTTMNDHQARQGSQ
jgi:hypothetical protein